MRTLRVVSAGTVAYGPALDWQRDLHARRVARRISDVVLLLEHPHVYTLGRRFSPQHLLLGEEALASRGIEVHECDRGGSITYHGPGQLVGYPIVALDEAPLAPGTGARRSPDAIAYLRCLEEALIRAVHPSGGVTSLARILGEAPPMEAVEQAVAVHLASVLGARVRTATLQELGLAPPPEEVPRQAPAEGPAEGPEDGREGGSAAVGLLGVTIQDEARILPFPGLRRARNGPVTAGK